MALLAALLSARVNDGADFRMIGAGRRYVGGGAAGEDRVGPRLLASWRDGRRLAEAAAAAGCAVLSLTDPPFLAFHLARRLPPGRLWIEWSMDLYPQALWGALGLHPRGFPCVRGRLPDLHLHLGPRQAGFLAARDAPPPPRLILPAGGCDLAPSAVASSPQGRRMHALGLRRQPRPGALG